MLTLKKTVGILGGSFDPPHKGHVEISKISLKKIRLKKVYWIITKKNPFKKKPFFSLKERISKSNKTVKNYKKIKVIYLDEKIKSSRTINVINYFRKINTLFKNKLKNAQKIDWKTEYLDAKISIKTVKNVKDAINHILKYGTMHTDSIITNSSKNAKIFLNGVNSSIAMHNVSTQFADGGEFGFGGEIGISTNKLPPRGPVGINQLTSYKYIVSGKGIIRS